MENAVDALKIAFAVLVFVIAFTVIMTMFTQARETADLVLQRSDITEYMDYIEVSQIVGGTANEGTDRIVGLETIIPTLYKYYKENYTVIFLHSNGKPLTLYTSQRDPVNWSGYGQEGGYTNRYYNDPYETEICAFDVNEETSRREPWVGSNEKFKENLDHFLEGGVYEYSASNVPGGIIRYDYGQGFIKEYEGYQFRESLGEYTYNETPESQLEQGQDDVRLPAVQEKTKRVIIYTLLD